MENLIKAELFKLKKSTTYKALLLIYFIMEAAVQINNISNSVIYPKYNPSYTGAEWLSNVGQAVLLYSVAVFLFTAFYVNGDFTAHTFYTSLLCGMPRKNAFCAKIISLFAGTVPLLSINIMTGTILWSIHSGFGMGFGRAAVLLAAKSLVRQILVSVMLLSNAVFFSVIAKSKIGTFALSFGTLYVFGVLRGNIGNIVPYPILSEILIFLLSLSYLNIGTFLISIPIKLLAAGYIFERIDLR